jgi:rhodanese-related sulfurtransferase
MRSMQVANFLLSNGFKSIVNLQGGIDAWSREIDTSLERY